MGEKYPVIPPEERKPLGWLFSSARLAEAATAPIPVQAPNPAPPIEESETDERQA